MFDYEVTDAIYQIPIADIYASDDFNCRDTFTRQSVKGLAETIREVGSLLEAIAIQPMEDVPEGERVDKRFRVVAGHRRLAAIELLGWSTIDARIVKGLTALDAARFNLLENIERQNLNVLEEATALSQAWVGVSDKLVAKQLKKPLKWVQVRRQLIDFPDEIQQAASSGRITQHDIEYIGRAEPERRLHIFNLILAKKAGKPVSIPRVKGNAYKKSTRPKMGEVNAMIVHIMELSQVMGYDCAAVISALAWSQGNITTREFLENRLPLHYDESVFND
jgi:ParB/RepB/Spo0J family partition protein